MIAWRCPRRDLCLIFLFFCFSTPNFTQTASSKSDPQSPKEDFRTTLQTVIREEIDQWKSDNDIGVNVEVANLILNGFLKRQEILKTVSRSQLIEAEGPIHFLRSLVRQYLYDVRDWKIKNDLSFLVKVAAMGLAFTKSPQPVADEHNTIEPKDVHNYYSPERWLDKIFGFFWRYPLLPDIPLGEVSVKSRPKAGLITVKMVVSDAQGKPRKNKTIRTDIYTNRDIKLYVGQFEIAIVDKKRNLNCNQIINITAGGHESIECIAK
jgi:hypothetical protein